MPKKMHLLKEIERRFRKQGAELNQELMLSAVRQHENTEKLNAELQAEIIERRQAEAKLDAYQQRLRQLVREQSRTEEKERRRVASELHDSIGQILAVSKMRLGWLKGLTSPSHGEFMQTVNEVYELIEQTIHQTRSLIFELSPPVLYVLGFEAAVRWLAEHLQEKHGIHFTVEGDGQPKPISDEIRTVLYKSVRELLFNVVKHSKAKESTISIRKEDGSLRVAVEDRGTGFNISKDENFCSAGCGFGLFSMKERIESVGGEFKIESEVGRGTRATLILPL